jgi:hypothetical protein
MNQNFAAEGRYPLASLPNQALAGSVLQHCCQCGLQLAISKWDKMTGLLVQCPHCGGCHGNSWSLKHVILAGLIFGPLAFPFVMPFRKAASWFVACCAVYLIGFLAIMFLPMPDLIMILAGFLLVGIAPVITIFQLVRHEMDLVRKPQTQMSNQQMSGANAGYRS